MKITVIEMSHDEAMGLFLTMKNEEPEITEIHEDFEEAIHEPSKPEKKHKVKKGKGGRPRKKAAEEKEPAGDEPEDVP